MTRTMTKNRRSVSTAIKTSAALGALTLATAGVALASSRFEEIEAYRDMLTTRHLGGDDVAARRKAEALLDRLADGPLRMRLAAETGRADEMQAPDPAELAYATGTKQEFYCLKQGLVLAEGRHGDGAVSRLVLISADRKMEADAYSLVRGGSQWIYELSNTHRPAVRSEMWQSFGQENGFNMFEVRRLAAGGFDQGSWSVEWEAGRTRSNFSINGEELEPVRSMMMANQYHLWGSPKLGYDLTFNVGYTDTLKFFEKGKNGRFPLKATRKVAERLPELIVKDAEGTDHTYADCYRVDLRIEADARPVKED